MVKPCFRNLFSGHLCEVYVCGFCVGISSLCASEWEANRWARGRPSPPLSAILEQTSAFNCTGVTGMKLLSGVCWGFGFKSFAHTVLLPTQLLSKIIHLPFSLLRKKQVAGPLGENLPWATWRLQTTFFNKFKVLNVTQLSRGLVDILLKSIPFILFY